MEGNGQGEGKCENITKCIKIKQNCGKVKLGKHFTERLAKHRDGYG